MSTITGNPAPLAGNLRHLPPPISHQRLMSHPFVYIHSLPAKARALPESLTELGSHPRNEGDECGAFGIAEEELEFIEPLRAAQLFSCKSLADIAQLTFQWIMTRNTLAPVSTVADGGK